MRNVEVDTTDYGQFDIQIETILKERGISKTRVCKEMDIPRTNFNRYCQNKLSRWDVRFLLRMCWYLNVDLSELIEYKRPEDKEKQQEIQIK